MIVNLFALCPSCGMQTLALTTENHCPVCAPVPDRVPHDWHTVEGRFSKAARTGEPVEGMIEIHYGGRVLQVSVELLRDPQFPVGTFILRKLVDR